MKSTFLLSLLIQSFCFYICFGQPSIYQVSPDSSAGNLSPTISVIGDGFSNTSTFSCRFNTSFTVAQCFNSSFALCFLDSSTQIGGSFFGLYFLSVSNDGILFSNSLPVNFYVLPIINSVSPLQLQYTSTPTNITISGNWFLGTSPPLSFAFGPTRSPLIWPRSNASLVVRLASLPNAYARIPLIVSNDNFVHNFTFSSYFEIFPTCPTSSSTQCARGGPWDARYCNCTECPSPWSGPLCDQCQLSCSGTRVLNSGSCQCVCADGSDSENCSDFLSTTPQANQGLVAVFAVLVGTAAILPLLLAPNSAVRKSPSWSVLAYEARALLEYFQFISLYGFLSVDFVPTVERFSTFFAWSNLIAEFPSLQTSDVYITRQQQPMSSQSCFLSASSTPQSTIRAQVVQRTGRSLKSVAGASQDTGVPASLLFVSNLSTLLSCMIGSVVLFSIVGLVRGSDPKRRFEVIHRMLWCLLSFAFIGFGSLCTTSFFQFSLAAEQSSVTLVTVAALVIATFALPLIYICWLHSASIHRTPKTTLPLWLISSPIHQCLFTDPPPSPENAFFVPAILIKKLACGMFLGAFSNFPLVQIVGQIISIFGFVVFVLMRKPFESVARLFVEIATCVLQCISLGLAIPLYLSPCTSVGSVPTVIVAMHALGLVLRSLPFLRACAVAMFCRELPPPGDDDATLDYEKGLEIVKSGYIVRATRSGSLLAPPPKSMTGAIQLQDIQRQSGSYEPLQLPNVETKPNPAGGVRLGGSPRLASSVVVPSSLTRAAEFLSRSPAPQGYAPLEMLDMQQSQGLEEEGEEEQESELVDQTHSLKPKEGRTALFLRTHDTYTNLVPNSRPSSMEVPLQAVTDFLPLPSGGSSRPSSTEVDYENFSTPYRKMQGYDVFAVSTKSDSRPPDRGLLDNEFSEHSSSWKMTSHFHNALSFKPGSPLGTTALPPAAAAPQNPLVWNPSHQSGV